MAESINGLRKSELIYDETQGPWRAVEDVELATLAWVHWWNNDRIFEPIGYVPLVEFGKNWNENRPLRSPERPANNQGGITTPDKPSLDNNLEAITN
jgi:hypothetical protein